MKEELLTDLSKKETYLQFVKKNKKIWENFKNIDGSKYKEFIEAYRQSRFEDKIFSDDNFFHYTLNGLEQTLQYTDAMNLLMYMCALATYTKQQKVRDEDQYCKQSMEDSLEIFKQDSSLEERLVESVVETYKITESQQTAIINKIAALPDFRRYFIKITPAQSDYADVIYHNIPVFLSDFNLAQISNQQSNDVSFFCSIQKRQTSYFIPAFSIIQCVLDVLLPYIKVFPIAGRISQEKLADLRMACLSPMQIYNAYIKFNMTQDLNEKKYVFDLLCHDLFHLFKIPYLKENEYLFIFKWLVPKLKNLQHLMQQAEIISAITEAINFLSDFNYIQDTFKKIIRASFQVLLKSVCTNLYFSHLVIDAIFDNLISSHSTITELYGIDSYSVAQVLCDQISELHGPILAEKFIKRLEPEIQSKPKCFSLLFNSYSQLQNGAVNEERESSNNSNWCCNII